MTHLLRNRNVDSALESALFLDEHGVQTVSTHQVAPNLRNAVWEAHNRNHLIGLKAGSPSTTGLMGSMRSAVVNGMSVADITGNAHTVERTPAMAQRMQGDSLMFTYVLSGESFHFNGTSPVLVKQGEVAVYDSDSPFMLGFSEGMHAVVATVPRHLLADVGMEDAFRSLKVMRHTGSSLESQATRRLLDVLQGAFEPPAGIDPHDFGELFVGDALRAMRQLSGKHRDTSNDYYSEAIAYIDDNLGAPDLSVVEIAAALNLSARHLSRIFAAVNSTVAQEIQHRRLERAWSMLTSTDCRLMSAAEIAEHSGFTSPSHFSRTFRQRFDMSPTEARRETIA